jgi:hypothetical protein
MDRFSFEDGTHDRQLLLGAKSNAVLERWYRLLLAAGPDQRLSLADYVRGPAAIRTFEKSRASTPSRRTVLKMLPVDFVCAGQWSGERCYHCATTPPRSKANQARQRLWLIVGFSYA